MPFLQGLYKNCELDALAMGRIYEYWMHEILFHSSLY